MLRRGGAGKRAAEARRPDFKGRLKIECFPRMYFKCALEELEERMSKFCYLYLNFFFDHMNFHIIK